MGGVVIANLYGDGRQIKNRFLKEFLEIWEICRLSARFNHYLEHRCHRNKLVIDVSLANKLMLEFEIYYNRSAKFLSLEFPLNSSQLIDICRYFILTFLFSLTRCLSGGFISRVVAVLRSGRRRGHFRAHRVDHFLVECEPSPAPSNWYKSTWHCQVSKT